MNDESPDPKGLELDLTARTIGDYSLIRRLGRGGMADVYLAKQISLQRNVALKVLKPELARDDAYVQRFVREAQAAAALVQSNIVQIYEVGQAEGLHFIAQEYIQGRNLRQYIGRHGSVRPVMAINVLRQVGMALQKAQESSVIHRDIKPENIMLSTKGEVKVTDFGLARVNNDAARQDLTQIGITMGTPLYMSPEQVEGGAVDTRTDLYSLGVTVYHMLAGHPPFEGDNALSIAVQHVKNPPAPLGAIRPDIPSELCDLIHRLLAKAPDDRPADADAFLRELRKIKIDVDEDWDQLVDRLATSETASIGNSPTLAQSKLAVTRQLQEVMRGNLRSWWTSPMVVASLILLPLLGVALGTYLASSNPPQDLLAASAAQLDLVPRKENVDDQYTAAYFGDTDLHWRSVYEYFPAAEAESENRNHTRYVNNKAKARLGEWYLARSKYIPAKEVYTELSQIPADISNYFRIFGLAGLAIIADHEGSDEIVRQHLEEVVPDIDRLNEFMRLKIRDLEVKYQTDSLTAR